MSNKEHCHTAASLKDLSVKFSLLDWLYVQKSASS